MKKLIAVGFAACFGIALALPAQAMPIGGIDTTALSMVTTVAGGCGPGRHRGPRGGCLRNWKRPALHACPRGYHLSRSGRCRRNW
jgi:hypothetical protein